MGDTTFGRAPSASASSKRALEPTAASGLRALAVPSLLRASAAARRARWAAPSSGIACSTRFDPNWEEVPR